jgi:hypothetical protein
MALRVSAFPGEDGDVLEAAERAEGHLAEDAETEKRERRSDQAQGMVFRERAAREIQERHRDEGDDGDQENYGSDIVDPFADSETEAGDAHRSGDHGGRRRQR